MRKQRAGFLQIEVTRAIRGATSAGLVVSRVEVDPVTGRIVVFSGSGEAFKADDAASAFDDWKAGRAR